MKSCSYTAVEAAGTQWRMVVVVVQVVVVVIIVVMVVMTMIMTNILELCSYISKM